MTLLCTIPPFQYIDTLLEDLGIDTVRRKNPLAELFMPAYPRNYNGMVGEFRHALASRRGPEYVHGSQEGAKDQADQEKLD